MKNVIATQDAPQAIGPYSQGIAAAGLVFTSGQLPVDPASGQFAAQDIAGQTRQSILNLQEVLQASGSDLSKVIKTTVFLSDMENFAAMNTVYAELFGTQAYPARSCVQVARLPKDALIEIEAIALG